MKNKQEQIISLQENAEETNIARGTLPFFPEKKVEAIIEKPINKSLLPIFGIYFVIFITLFSLTVFGLWKILFKSPSF